MSLEVIETDTYRSATCDVTFHSNHWVISYHFRDKRRFQSKIANFSHPRVFCVPAEGVPLGNEYRRSGSKNENHGATGRRKKFDDIISPLDTLHQRDGRTDGQTGCHSKKTALTGVTRVEN